jgi:hypothetical protein
MKKKIDFIHTYQSHYIRGYILYSKINKEKMNIKERNVNIYFEIGDLYPTILKEIQDSF